MTEGHVGVGGNPTPKRSQLESFSPTDERFSEVSSSSEQVFHISEDERASLQALEDRTEVVSETGDYEEAQRLGDSAKALKLELDAKELMFRLVCECEVDSRLCLRVGSDNSAAVARRCLNATS